MKYRQQYFRTRMAYIRPSFLLILLAFVVATAMTVSATDPDILTDYITPENSTIDGNFFTYTGMRGIFSYITPTFNATKASVVEFPALNGQSVSLAVLKFPGGSINPLHTHPRASELLILIGGELEVGVVDTKNVLYTQVLQPGDIFVFPKGLVHYQYNPLNIPAYAISAFGSANAGTVSLPKTIFTSGIDDSILAEAFKTDVATIEKIKNGLSMS